VTLQAKRACDRRYLDRVATHILAFEEDGGIH
jgi:hypothetical protein